MSIKLRPRTGGINGRLWGARARDWADIQEGKVRPVYEAVLERTRVREGTRFLDVGCGAGMAAQIAAARGAKVSGIDAAEALLDIARHRTPEGDFRRGDLEEQPFDDCSFDVVTGFNSFQYAGNPAVALGEARRATEASGPHAADEGKYRMFETCWPHARQSAFIIGNILGSAVIAPWRGWPWSLLHWGRPVSEALREADLRLGRTYRGLAR
jgi:SAM-dependent methyltransferase